MYVESKHQPPCKHNNVDERQKNSDECFLSYVIIRYTMNVRNKRFLKTLTKTVEV